MLKGMPNNVDELSVTGRYMCSYGQNKNLSPSLSARSSPVGIKLPSLLKDPMDSLTQAQVRNGLKDINSIVQFMSAELGYRTAPVFYENPTQDLRIPSYLSTKINSWWLLCSYPGEIPFQIHLAEIKELTFHACRDIAIFFLRSHPANYLFVYTKNYSHIVFFCVERSFEKRPYTWTREPKYYCRFLVTDCRNPTHNDLLVLDKFRLDQLPADPDAIYNKVVNALKVGRGSIPTWFMPWYYRLGFSRKAYDRLRRSGLI